MNEAEAEVAIRKMAREVDDPLGGVLRSLLAMVDKERARVDATWAEAVEASIETLKRQQRSARDATWIGLAVRELRMLAKVRPRSK